MTDVTRRVLPSARIAKRVKAAADSRAFDVFCRVRTEVLRMLDEVADGDGAIASSYWEEEMAGFEYLFDASPLLIQNLRQQTYHLTGLRHHDYRSNRDHDVKRFREKLAALVEAAGGRDLLVPEAADLGGFGFRIGGAMYNIDTLKFFEVMIGLERSGILAMLRERETPRIWEVGAGWGGFAYTMKRVFPGLRYVISDLPPVMLFSATYLGTLFPEAKLAFLHASDPVDDAIWDADFVFVPHTLTDRVRPDRIDAMVNMVSFQEMTSEQVDGYVAHARSIDVPYVYSLNRDRSSYNPELSTVREILERHYWLHQLHLMDVPYTKMLDAAPARKRPKDNDVAAYRHVYGFRRVT